jgi:predicted RNA-binding Zn-ribbon protein involved in translation (DUF1610 family)
MKDEKWDVLEATFSSELLGTLALIYKDRLAGALRELCSNSKERGGATKIFIEWDEKTRFFTHRDNGTGFLPEREDFLKLQVIGSHHERGRTFNKWGLGMSSVFGLSDSVTIESINKEKILKVKHYILENKRSFAKNLKEEKNISNVPTGTETVVKVREDVEVSDSIICDNLKREWFFAAKEGRCKVYFNGEELTYDELAYPGDFCEGIDGYIMKAKDEKGEANSLVDVKEESYPISIPVAGSKKNKKGEEKLTFKKGEGKLTLYTYLGYYPKRATGKKRPSWFPEVQNRLYVYYKGFLITSYIIPFSNAFVAFVNLTDDEEVYRYLDAGKTEITDYAKRSFYKFVVSKLKEIDVPKTIAKDDISYIASQLALFDGFTSAAKEVKCPQCGSVKIRKSGLPYHFICEVCGAEWDNPKKTIVDGKDDKDGDKQHLYHHYICLIKKCGYKWAVLKTDVPPKNCPQCGSANIRRNTVSTTNDGCVITDVYEEEEPFLFPVVGLGSKELKLCANIKEKDGRRCFPGLHQKYEIDKENPEGFLHSFIARIKILFSGDAFGDQKKYRAEWLLSDTEQDKAVLRGNIKKKKGKKNNGSRLEQV